MNHDQTEANALQLATNNADDGRSSAGALMLDIKTMESLMKVANLMANGKTTVPKHLQGNPADCMAVVTQAMQWGMNPFAVAQKTHIVNGALGYEAQLVNAVVQQSRTIVGRFHYEYQGNAGAIECRVGAQIKGDDCITWGEWLCENKVTTKNSPLWKTNVKQQLGYLQVKNWARLYCPGAILGVYSEDELEAIPPRDMGNADVVSDWSPELLAAGKEAASKGAKGYQDFWKNAVPADVRMLLAKTSEHEQFKADALAADRARTVDNKPVVDATPKDPAPTDTPDTDAPRVTFDDILKRINDAQNEDALYVAMDWANELTDQSHIKALEDRFNERLFEMRGAA